MIYQFEGADGGGRVYTPKPGAALPEGYFTVTQPLKTVSCKAGIATARPPGKIQRQLFRLAEIKTGTWLYVLKSRSLLLTN
jgi:hypothetical protein